MTKSMTKSTIYLIHVTQKPQPPHISITIHTKCAAQDEDSVFEYVKNTFDTITETSVLSDYYYSSFPTKLPDTPYIIIEDSKFRNWKLYRIVTEDFGWIRSVINRRAELITEIRCQEIELLQVEDYETKKQNFINNIKRLLDLNNSAIGTENKKKHVYEVYDEYFKPFGKLMLQKHKILSEASRQKLHEGNFAE
jgi:hypothetical protein